MSPRRKLGEPARHRHGRVERGERRCRHLELEPAVEQLRLLARRLGQDQEELVCAARVPERGVAAADQLRATRSPNSVSAALPASSEPVRLLISPKSSRSTWIRHSGRPCRRAALISRGSASSKALALPRPVRESVRRAAGLRGSGTRSARPARRGARSRSASSTASPSNASREPGVDGERAERAPRAGRRGRDRSASVPTPSHEATPGRKRASRREGPRFHRASPIPTTRPEVTDEIVPS